MWRCTVVAAVLATLVAPTQGQTLFQSLFTALFEGGRQFMHEPADVGEPLAEYDFIIVGAGTAGCAMASRLSENPEWKVLLIEAGRTENLVMDYPLLANYLQFTEANWNYYTQPSNTSCLGMERGQCRWPRGKVMGGSSVLNYMIHTRGHRKDYDNWAQMGNEGWSFDEVMPYFKKSEKFLVDPTEMGYQGRQNNEFYHNRHGNVAVSSARFRTKIAENVIEGARQLGEPIVDYNGATMTGYSYLQVNIDDGMRASSSRSYLHPVRRRRNLHVKKYSEVTRVIINPITREALGVKFENDGRVYTVRARREVILSAGAINTPKLLMLSGVGPKKELSKFDIPVLSDLRVGYNLMDHIALGGLTYLINKPYSVNTYRVISNRSALIDFLSYHNGPITMAGGCESIAFYDLLHPGDPNGHPDLELLFQAGSIVSDPLLRRNFGIKEDLYQNVFGSIEGKDSWMVWPMILRPESRGRITIQDTNPHSKPLIFPNYLTRRRDVEVAVAGVRKVQQLAETPAMKKMGSRLHKTPIPACKHFVFDSDLYWECQIRHLTFTVYHYSGTCKMGPKSDRTAVVDPRLRVYGIKNLRVVDASIIPVIPAAHTNAPTYMIAEKAADMVKQDWGYID